MEETEFVTNLFSQMGHLWAQGELCDVHLCIQGTVIPAHRIVLAALSPYFKAMFCSQLNESHQFQVTIEDVNPKTIETIVNFAYTASLQLSEETVQSVMQIASMMQISAIEKLCSVFLEKQLNPANCLGIRNFAQLIGSLRLKEVADKYCEEHFFDASQNEEFLNLGVDEVIGLISRDSLKVAKEEEVYAAVMRWMEYDLDRSKKDIVMIMDHVRLPLVHWDFLTKEIIKDKVFVTNEECRNYLQQAKAFQASVFHPDLNNFELNEAVLRSQPRDFFSVTDRLYAVGGESNNREILSSFESFNPFTNQSEELPALPEVKRSLGIAILDKIIYAIGGATGESSRTVHAFDIDKQRWWSCRHLCEARSSVVVAVVAGCIVALGGHGLQGILSSAERYHVELNSWSFITEMQESRSMAAAAVIDSRLYLCGGYNGHEDVQSCQLLDAKTWQWASCSDMNEARSLFGASAVGGQVYVLGGCRQNLSLSSAEVYNPATDGWTMINPMMEPRRGAGLKVIGDVLYIAGGHDGSTLHGTIIKYHTISGEWTVIGNLITKRCRFGCL